MVQGPKQLGFCFPELIAPLANLPHMAPHSGAQGSQPILGDFPSALFPICRSSCLLQMKQQSYFEIVHRQLLTLYQCQFHYLLILYLYLLTQHVSSVKFVGQNRQNQHGRSSKPLPLVWPQQPLDLHLYLHFRSKKFQQRPFHPEAVIYLPWLLDRHSYCQELPREVDSSDLYTYLVVF